MQKKFCSKISIEDKLIRTKKKKVRDEVINLIADLNSF